MGGWDPDDKSNACNDAHSDDPAPVEDMLLILAFVFFFAIPWLWGVIGIIRSGIHLVQGWFA